MHQAPQTAPTGRVGEQLPNVKDASSASAARHPNGIEPVSAGRHSHCADLRREVAIQQLGREIEGHLADVALINNREPHVFLDFADAAMARGKADLARKRMEQLISERSPEQVARMARESHERMAREPGAERS